MIPRKTAFFAALVALAGLAPLGARAATRVSPASCGWTVRSDPVAGNVLYPDKDAVYFIGALPTPPPGAFYRVIGDFPHARYMSFVTYNGLPVDSLLDNKIVPDGDSTNPFVIGADRTAAHRSYTLTIQSSASGGQRPSNTMYMSPGQLGTPVAVGYLYYRIYVPDNGTGLRGGVGLPRIQLVLPAGDGSADTDVVDCEGVRDLAPGAAGVQDFFANTSTPDAPASYLRATNPPTWTVQSGLTSAAFGAVGRSDLVSGGPGSNPDNNYIVANVSRSLGDVLVIRAKAPSAPETRAGDPLMQDGDLRYWSWCQNSRSTRYVDCISDEGVSIDPDGWFTIVVSTPDKRPSSAKNWIPWGPEPDGQLIYRHMLPSNAFFPHSAQGVAAGNTPIQVAMGDYFPQGVYCSADRYEEDRCVT